MLGMNLQTELSISKKKISDKIKYCLEIIPYCYQVCYYIHCSNQMWFKINPLIALSIVWNKYFDHFNHYLE